MVRFFFAGIVPVSLATLLDDPCYQLCQISSIHIECDLDVIVFCDDDNLCYNMFRVPTGSTTSSSTAVQSGTYVVNTIEGGSDTYESIGCDEARGLLTHLSDGTNPSSLKRSRSDDGENFVTDDRNLRVRTEEFQVNGVSTFSQQSAVTDNQRQPTRGGRWRTPQSPNGWYTRQDIGENDMEETEFDEHMVQNQPHESSSGTTLHRSYTMYHGPPFGGNVEESSSGNGEENTIEGSSNNDAITPAIQSTTQDTVAIIVDAEIPHLTFEPLVDDQDATDILDSVWADGSALHEIGGLLIQLKQYISNSVVPLLSRFPFIDESDTNAFSVDFPVIYSGIVLAIMDDHKDDLAQLTENEIDGMKFLTHWTKSVMFMGNIYMSGLLGSNIPDNLRNFVGQNLDLLLTVNDVLKFNVLNQEEKKLISKVTHLAEQEPIDSDEAIATKLLAIQKKAILPLHHSMACTVCNALYSFSAAKVVSNSDSITAHDDHDHQECSQHSSSGYELPIITRFGDLVTAGIRSLNGNHPNENDKPMINRPEMIRAHGEHFLQITLQTHKLAENLSEDNPELEKSLPYLCEHHAKIVLEFFLPASTDAAALTSIFKSLVPDTRAAIDLVGRVCVEHVPLYIREMLSSYSKNVLYSNIDEQDRIGVVTIKQNVPTIFMESVFSQMQQLTRIDFHTLGHVIVQFQDEQPEGAGPVRQTVGIFLAELLSEQLKIFVPTSAANKLYYKPNPALVAMETKSETIGKVVGLAISLNVPINLQLSPGAIALLRNPEFGKTLIDNEKIVEYFKIQDEQNYKALFEGDLAWTIGTEFPITTTRSVESKADYNDYKIECARQETVESIRPLMRAMLRGIYQVLPYYSLGYKTHSEIMATISGFGADYPIDVVELKRSATHEIYIHESVESIRESFGPKAQTTIDTNFNTNKTVKFLWDILEKEFTNEQLQDFLYFVSGSRYPPPGGFTGPKGDKKWIQIRVTPYYQYKYRNSENVEVTKLSRRILPTAATCFFRITIGQYKTKKELKKWLLEAIAGKEMHNQ